MISILELLKTIPLPTVESYSYSEARAFSRELDLKLGFQIESTEDLILKIDPQTPWAGLDPQALQTPYSEIRMMFSALNLKPEQTVIDLGAGYGRMGLVGAVFHPDQTFLNYEISPERAMEGQRIYRLLQKELSANRFELTHADITRSDFIIPRAEVYFIYDFSDLESIIRVLDQLKIHARQQAIKVVGRGRRTRDHIERHEPWLSQVVPPEHLGNFSIYYSE